MEQSDIKLTDLKRIFIGDAPPVYLLEVVLRTIIIYIIFLVIIRFLGKRMAGQLTITELSVVILLGAIISPAMQLPERGILQSAVLLICILVYHNTVALWGVKNAKVEKLTQGTLTLLVKDGVLQLKEMEKMRIAKQQLYAAIRNRDIYNLGKVERLYLEACGLFTIYHTAEDKPGLSILPPSDPEITEILKPCADSLKACCNCGHTQTLDDAMKPCDVCHETKWNSAFM